jgi:hypothetical protein
LVRGKGYDRCGLGHACLSPDLYLQGDGVLQRRNWGRILFWSLIGSLVLTIVGGFVPSVGWAQAPMAGPAPQKAPNTCRVGIYVTGLRGFDFNNHSFSTDFDVWSVCPSPDLQPLNSLELIGAIDSEMNNMATVEVVNQSDTFSPRTTLYWSQAEIKATLYYRWNLKNYPFDRQQLTINIQESMQDAGSFIYTPDFLQSGYQKSIPITGWKIEGFSIQERTIEYDTTFGNPSLSDGTGRYSRLVITLDLQRSNLVSFLKLTAGVYAAVALSAMSLLLNEDYADRLGILVGTLFAAVVNLQVADSALGQTDSFTLTDFIHVMAILYIFATACISLYSRKLTEAGQNHVAVQLDRRIALPIFIVSFVLFNSVVIAYAAIVG